MRCADSLWSGEATPWRFHGRRGWDWACGLRSTLLEPALSNGVARRTARPGRAVAPAALRSALLTVLLSACGSPSPGPAPAAETCPIPVAIAAPTFSGHVLPMLRSTCGAGSATSCPGTPSPVGHVSYAPSLSAAEVWGQLVGVDPSNAPPGVGWKRVAARDVPHSWLIQKVTTDNPGGAGQAYGNRMPYGLPNLCPPTVQTLENWIQLGALDD